MAAVTNKKEQRTVKAFDSDISLINEQAKLMECTAAEVIHGMCVVLSNDGMNTRIALSIVVPFTGTAWSTKYGELSPIMVEVNNPEGGQTKTSYSMAHQVRTVSHTRFSKKLASVNPATLDKIVKSVQDIIA